MRIVRLLLIIHLALITLTGCAGFDPHAADKTYLTGAVTKIDTAMNSKDVNTVVSYYAPNFSLLDEQGNTILEGKDQVTAFDTAIMQRTSSYEQHVVLKSITFDSTGGATLVEDGHYTFGFSRGGQAVQMKSHTISRDYWIKGPSGWLDVRSRAISHDNNDG